MSGQCLLEWNGLIIFIQSTLKHRRSRDWRKTAVLENDSKKSHLIRKKHIRDLKISGGIGGGGQRRGNIGGDDCTSKT